MKAFTLALALLFTTSVGSELTAQELPYTQDIERDLRAMVAAPTSADIDRATVSRFLDRVDVRAAASGWKLDLDAASERVGTLNASSARDLAARIEDLDRQLAGGQVVITSTAIVIALLVVILLLVAD